MGPHPASRPIGEVHGRPKHSIHGQQQHGRHDVVRCDAVVDEEGHQEHWGADGMDHVEQLRTRGRARRNSSADGWVAGQAQNEHTQGPGA